MMFVTLIIIFYIMVYMLDDNTHKLDMCMNQANPLYVLHLHPNHSLINCTVYMCIPKLNQIAYGRKFWREDILADC